MADVQGYFSNLIQDPLFNFGLQMLAQGKYGSLSNGLANYQGWQQGQQASQLRKMQMEALKKQQEKAARNEALAAQIPDLLKQYQKPAVAGALDQGMLAPSLPIESPQAAQLMEQEQGSPLADVLSRINQSGNYAVPQGQEMPLVSQPASFDAEGFRQAALPLQAHIDPMGTMAGVLKQAEAAQQEATKKAEWDAYVAGLPPEIRNNPAAMAVFSGGPEFAGKIGPGVLPGVLKPTEKKSPTSVEEYEYAKANDGFKGSYLDFVKAKKERPQTIVVGGKPQYDVALQELLAEAKARGAKRGGAIGEMQGGLPLKEDALTAVQDAKQMLKDGIYTGAWAQIQKTGAKWTPGVDKQKAANTENFISAIGNTVVPRLKEFGGNDSNEEMRYLQRIQGGDITMEKEALEPILNRVEKYIERGIYRAQNGGNVNTPVPGEPKIPEKNKSGKLAAPATDADIKATARKYGITEAEVKRKLGIKD